MNANAARIREELFWTKFRRYTIGILIGFVLGLLVAGILAFLLLSPASITQKPISSFAFLEK